MQTNIYISLNIIVKTFIMELSRKCVTVQVPCDCHKMLAQKLSENIRSGQIYTKLMVLLYLFP